MEDTAVDQRNCRPGDIAGGIDLLRQSEAGWVAEHYQLGNRRVEISNAPLNERRLAGSADTLHLVRGQSFQGIVVDDKGTVSFGERKLKDRIGSEPYGAPHVVVWRPTERNGYILLASGLANGRTVGGVFLDPHQARVSMPLALNGTTVWSPDERFVSTLWTEAEPFTVYVFYADVGLEADLLPTFVDHPCSQIHVDDSGSLVWIGPTEFRFDIRLERSGANDCKDETAYPVRYRVVVNIPSEPPLIWTQEAKQAMFRYERR